MLGPIELSALKGDHPECAVRLEMLWIRAQNLQVKPPSLGQPARTMKALCVLQQLIGHVDNCYLNSLAFQLQQPQIGLQPFEFATCAQLVTSVLDPISLQHFGFSIWFGV